MVVKKVQTTCQACHCECGVIVHVENGKITKIDGDPDHLANHGFMCIKGKAYPEYVHHPDRLKYPRKRTGERGEGKWERITWDQALNEIAEKLTALREEYGPESFATITGTAPRPSKSAMHLLAVALGSPNTASTDNHVCAVPTGLAGRFTMGMNVTMERGPDYKNAECILIWGGNPIVSHPPKGREIVRAKRDRNVKLIVVDPRKTLHASQADLWLQVRPGTDDALALGMINVIVEEKLYDKEFVHKWCYGFDKLREHIKEFSPEKAAEITWVPAHMIREAARIYATIKPAALHNRVAIEHNINSIQTCRALDILIALTGNLDVKGGNVFSSLPGGYIPGHGILLGWGDKERVFRLPYESEKKRIGSEVYPLVSGPEAAQPFVIAPMLIDALLTQKPYPVKALFCAGGNPLNIQDCKRVWKALKTLNLFVVSDFFMTPHAEIADYVLPAAMWPERDEGCDGENMISPRQKAMEPLYECWDDLKISIELVKKLPWADRKFIPWDSVEEFNDWRVKGVGITFEDFKKTGCITAPVEYKKYEHKGFATPTGKVELYSTILEKYGYEPLPVYVEPPESPLSTPELLKKYPFILITGGRQINYFHSEGRQIPSLRRLVPDPEVEIHPEAASKLDLIDGDWVRIKTPQNEGESVKGKVTVTDAVHPMVIHVRHGWWYPEKPAPEHGCFESNINVVTTHGEPRDKIMGSVPDRGTLCNIYKVS